MEAVVIGLIRVAGSLPVLRWAFVGGLIAVFTDLSDLFWREWLDLGGIGDYQGWDKWMDQVYMALFLVVALRSWTGWERRIAAGLFVYRLVGFAAFEAGVGDRGILLYFPNVFEFWFLFAASRRHWPRRLTGREGDGDAPALTGRAAAGWLAFLAALKVGQEYMLHGGQWLDRYGAFEFVEMLWPF